MANFDDERREVAEERMRDLLDTAGLPPPDEVVHQEDQILFLWASSKTAVVLELVDEHAAADPAR